MYEFSNLMWNIERGACCTSSLSWINHNWIKSTILSITSFWGGFKEWNLEEFQGINWVILSIGSDYSDNWRIAKIEEVSESIISIYVMVGWWWWFNVKFYYLSYILWWKERERMKSSNISWYRRIVSSSWRFIPPFKFGSCSYLWKSLLPLNNNYWLFLIYCAWCIVVYWCNSYTICYHWNFIHKWLQESSIFKQLWGHPWIKITKKNFQKVQKLYNQW